MASFIPNTREDRDKMLARLGLKNIDELFDDIPKDKRFPSIKIPEGKSEIEIYQAINNHLSYEDKLSSYDCFLGAGSYNHFIPAIVDSLASRGEFTTAYTPYQPEASQGTLQAIFEYQSMVSDLIGMDVVNASHYDGATAMAEAVLMSIHQSRNKRKKVFLSRAIHPEYLSVVKTYTKYIDIEICIYDDKDLNLDTLAKKADDNTACLVIQYPDFFGRFQNLHGLADKLHKVGALLVVHTDPIACGLFKSPGYYNADIVTGEGQVLGNPMNFGGPYLGIFGCKKSLVRKMPGRIAGKTTDRNGKEGYVLTLNTREQHIRREKATSNICTNQGLIALRAAIYLAAMGKAGLKRIGELCFHKSHYAASQINGIPGCSVDMEKPFFKEFVITLPHEASRIIKNLSKKHIVPGIELSSFFPDMKNKLLTCITEMNSREQIDRLIDGIKGELT